MTRLKSFSPVVMVVGFCEGDLPEIRLTRTRCVHLYRTTLCRHVGSCVFLISTASLLLNHLVHLVGAKAANDVRIALTLVSHAPPITDTIIEVSINSGSAARTLVHLL